METVKNKECVLEKESIKRKIKRMALEVAEQNAGEKEIVIAGINGNGVTVANCIADELKELASLQVRVITIQLNKRELSEVTLEPAIDTRDKVVIIADDVANTGRVMFHALKPFLVSSPRKIKTLALVERSHKEFPIHTDYTGLSIATTLQEHIVVETEGKTIKGAWLH